MTDHMDGAQKEKAPKSALDAHAATLQMMESGAADRAVPLLDAALKRWPAHPKLLLLKGDLLAQTAGPNDAAAHYVSLLENEAIANWAAGRLTTLLRGAPTPIDEALAIAQDVCAARADVKLKEPALDILLNRDDPAERERMLDVLGSNSGIFKYESKLAIQKTEQGDFAAALTILETARHEGRTSLHSATLLADLLALSSRLPDSIRLLEELLAQYPDQPDIYRRLAMMLQRAADFTRAADVFESAVRRWPHDWMLTYRLNRLPIAHNKLEEVCAIIAAGADEVLSKNDRFRFQFALACLHLNQAERGFELLKQPFQEPVSILAVPVQNALRARNERDWTATSRLADDRTKEVQVTRSANARATLLLTTGIAFGNLPLRFIDTLFADHHINVIYLRDFGKRAYLRGIATFGATEAETIAALKRLVADLGAQRTIVMGSSSGGFSALRYGALMEADTAVSFSGPTALASYFDDTRVSAWNPNFFVKALMEREKDLPFDLVPLLSKPSPTKFIQFYGQHSAEDARQARRLEGLPDVTLTPVSHVSDHFVVDHMIGDRSFEALLDELTA